MFRRLELLGFAIIFIFISSFVLAQSVRAGSVFVFNKNLKLGNVSADVKELQKFLNNNGFFVNNSGLGSLGQETTFFGTATRNALIKFQKANKINPAVGYFGPVSRNVVNKNVESLVTAQTPLSNQVNDKQLVTQANNQPDQSVQDTTKKYFTVGGGITGITGAVILQNNGKDDLIIDIGDNSEFTFATAIEDGANYNVTAKPKFFGQTCFVSDNIGVVGGENIKNIKIACGANLPYNPFIFIPNSGVVSYSLTYSAGSGGTISGSTSQTVNSGNSGSAVTAVPDTGYSFVSWSDGVSTAQRTDSSITSNKTVSATFSINSYTVSYDDNGSSGGAAPANQAKTHDTTLVLASNSGTLVKTGYSFSGWNTSDDGTGTDYAVGADYTANVGVTLFAKWTADSFACGDNVSFTYNGSLVTYGTVSNPTTGKCWLDRNLGASQAALSSTDSAAYGDLFQWGRPKDGHQLINRTTGVPVYGTSSSKVANVAPGTNTFIVGYSDWSSIDSNGALRSTYLAKTDGTGICPAGFRLPTQIELETERLSWSSGNPAGAFASPLKLPVAGYRNNVGDSLIGVGEYGLYWSSSASESHAFRLAFDDEEVGVDFTNRATGFSVRCTASSYAVAYNNNGSTGGTVPSSQVKTYDDTLVLSINSGTLVKTGYTFSGWNTSADGAGTDYAVGDNYIVNDSVILYAKWTINTYTVIFDTNGGDGGSTAAQILDYNTPTDLTTNGFTRTGYTFAGWATTSGGAVEYANGASYTIGANNVTLYAKWNTAIVVGSSYQGGIVAYILQSGDPGYVAGETHGLIAAAANQSSGIIWAKVANQSTAVPGGTSTAIGSGSANTDNIIAQNGLDSTYAAGLARSYAGGGYNDWYLPSLDELTKLYDNRVAIGGFSAAYYWSSFEDGATTARSKHFSVGSVSIQAKSTPWTYVRAVRSF